MARRRGPDAAGLWSDGTHCQLGFRRLAILDLTPAGNQPMVSRDGRFILVFNGEVYNYPELRRELVSHGAAFDSEGDTAVVLAALRAWGVDALRRFNGMFALAFYDTVAKSLLLARDHAGMKPLYYSVSNRGVVFGSQYNQVLHHPWNTGAPLNLAALILFLRLGHLPAPWALHAGLESVPPGEWIRFDKGQTSRGRHFAFRADGNQPPLRGREAIEAISSTLDSAVRRCLRSDVPVGAFLSGGIDSALVAESVQRQRGQVKTFTFRSADQHDESDDAVGLAQHLGHRSELVSLPSGHWPDRVEEAALASTEPLADFSILPTLAVSEAASRQVKVVLTGDGGDELFWGYPRFLQAAEQAERLGTRTWTQCVKSRIRRFLGGDPELDDTLGTWFRRKHSRIRAPWFRRLFPEFPLWAAECDAFQSAAVTRSEALEWTRKNEFEVHLPMVLRKVDAASMHHSLEARVPWLDRDVISVALRCDWREGIDFSARRGKLPLRHLVQQQRLGRTTHEKRGFTLDLAAALRGPLRELVDAALLARPNLGEVPIQMSAVRALFAEHCAERADHSRALWTLMSLSLWQTHHGRAPFPQAWSAAQAPVSRASREITRIGTSPQAIC